LLPLDPFKLPGSFSFAAQYDYFGLNLNNTFVLRSVGPDGRANIGCSPQGFNCFCVRGVDCLVANGLEGCGLTHGVVSAIGTELDSFGVIDNLEDAFAFGSVNYSPTNGIASWGDLLRLESILLGPEPTPHVSHWNLY